jgi:hypothetical protein
LLKKNYELLLSNPVIYYVSFICAKKNVHAIPVSSNQTLFLCLPTVRIPDTARYLNVEWTPTVSSLPNLPPRLGGRKRDTKFEQLGKGAAKVLEKQVLVLAVGLDPLFKFRVREEENIALQHEGKNDRGESMSHVNSILLCREDSQETSK